MCAVKSPSLATDGKCTDEILADQRRRGWVGRGDARSLGSKTRTL